MSFRILVWPIKVKVFPPFINGNQKNPSSQVEEVFEVGDPEPSNWGECYSQ